MDSAKIFLRVLVVLGFLWAIYWMMTYRSNKNNVEGGEVVAVENSTENGNSAPTLQNLEQPSNTFNSDSSLATTLPQQNTPPAAGSTTSSLENDMTTPSPQTINSEADLIDPDKGNNTAASGLSYLKKRFKRDNKYGTYYGPALDGSPDGFGVLRYENGDVYIGEYKRGERDGMGVSAFKGGKIALKKFENGNVTKENKTDYSFKKETFKREDGSGTYEGSWRNGLPYGVGVFTYDNGTMYIGEYKEGQRHGRGNLVDTKSNTVSIKKYDMGKEVK